MDISEIAPIALAITSLGTTILAYRRFSSETAQAQRQAALAEQQAALAEQQLEIEKAKAGADISTSTTKAATELVDDLAADRKYLREQVTYFQNEINRITAELNAKYERTRSELAEVQLELYQAQERITALETENEQAHERETALETENERLREENESLRARK